MSANDPARELEARGIDLALAEYQALRAEIVGARSTQGAFVGVGLTAVGVVFAFAAQSPGRAELLLAVPPLAFVVSMLHLAESHRIHRLGDHIRTRVWTYLTDRATYKHSWEDRHSDVWNLRGKIAAAVFDGVVPILFAAISIIAAVFARIDWEDWRSPEVVFTVGSVFLTFAAPLAFAWVYKKKRDAAPSDGGTTGVPTA